MCARWWLGGRSEEGRSEEGFGGAQGTHARWSRRRKAGPRAAPAPGGRRHRPRPQPPATAAVRSPNPAPAKRRGRRARRTTAARAAAAGRRRRARRRCSRWCRRKWRPRHPATRPRRARRRAPPRRARATSLMGLARPRRDGGRWWGRGCWRRRAGGLHGVRWCGRVRRQRACVGGEEGGVEQLQRPIHSSGTQPARNPAPRQRAVRGPQARIALRSTHLPRQRRPPAGSPCRRRRRSHTGPCFSAAWPGRRRAARSSGSAVARRAASARGEAACGRSVAVCCSYRRLMSLFVVPSTISAMNGRRMTQHG